MASSAGTLELVVRELSLALSVLPDRIAGLGVEGLLTQLGLRSPLGLVTGDVEDSITAASGSAGELAALVTTLTAAIDANDMGAIIATGRQLVTKLGEITSAVAGFGAAIGTAASTLAGLTPKQRQQVATFGGLLPRRLVDYLLIEYLSRRAPSAVAWLELLRVIDRVSEPGTPDEPLSPPYVRRELHLEYLLNLIADPGRYARTAYDWGNPAFNGVALLGALQRFLEEWPVLPAVLLTPAGQPALLEAYLFGLRIDDSTTPPGLAVSLRFPGTQDFTRTYPLRPPWTLTTTASGRFVADVQGTITPPAEIELRPPTGTVQMSVTFGLRGERPGERILLFGVTGGTGLRASRIDVALRMKASWSDADNRATISPSVDAQLIGGELVVGLGGADGFLAQVLPRDGLRADFELGAGWSPREGLRLHGAADVETTLPVHVALGPVTISSIFLRLHVSEADLQLTMAATAGVQLGPLQATVEGVGLEGNLRFADGGGSVGLVGGNLGPIDLKPRFKPPKGVGLNVAAGPVSGGGYLSFDSVAEQYAGALTLNLKALSLNAVGLLTTRMPDGSKGFSLLVIISAEFNPPIPLGPGFTLIGVGGLLGVNRTINEAALEAGLKDGSLDSVRMPRDVAANAARIVSDLRSAFPPAPNRCLLGPMVAIGWGKPTIVRLDLALILELPSPMRLLILGKLSIEIADGAAPKEAAPKKAAPKKKLSVVSIVLDVLGKIDLDQRLARMQGVLRDSQIASMPVSGEMAMMVTWGPSPTFALSAGGFHPRFAGRPPGFPDLARMAIVLADELHRRVRLEAYLAITANSLQVGAQLELYAAKELGGLLGFFEVKGHLSFDVLVRIAPFALIVDLSVALAMLRNGSVLCAVQLDLTLSGPTPWHAFGIAKFQVLGFHVQLQFDVVVGPEEPPAAIDPIDVAARVLAALGDLRNWSAALPATAGSLVTLRPQPAGTVALLVHPFGALTVTQQVAPLNLRLEVYGPAPVQGMDRLEIDTVRIGTATADRTPVRGFFAPGEFLTLSEDQKLTRPAFEPMDAGTTLTSPGLAGGVRTQTNLGYRTLVVDDRETAAPRELPDHHLRPDTMQRLARQGPAGRAPLRAAGEAAYAGPDQSIALAAPAYTVARTRNLTAPVTGGRTYAEADAQRRIADEARADDHADLQVVGAHEVLL